MQEALGACKLLARLYSAYRHQGSCCVHWPAAQLGLPLPPPLLCSLVLSEEHECCDDELTAAAARWAAMDAPCCALRPAAQGANAGEAEATFEAGLDIMEVSEMGRGTWARHGTADGQRSRQKWESAYHAAMLRPP